MEGSRTRPHANVQRLPGYRPALVELLVPAIWLRAANLALEGQALHFESQASDTFPTLLAGWFARVLQNFRFVGPGLPCSPEAVRKKEMRYNKHRHGPGEEKLKLGILSDTKNLTIG